MKRSDERFERLFNELRESREESNRRFEEMERRFDNLEDWVEVESDFQLSLHTFRMRSLSHWCSSIWAWHCKRAYRLWVECSIHMGLQFWVCMMNGAMRYLV